MIGPPAIVKSHFVVWLLGQNHIEISQTRRELALLEIRDTLIELTGDVGETRGMREQEQARCKTKEQPSPSRLKSIHLQNLANSLES